MLRNFNSPLALFLVVLGWAFHSTVEGVPLPNEETPLSRREPIRPTNARTFFDSLANELNGNFPNIIETLSPMGVTGDMAKTAQNTINFDDLSSFVGHAADLREEVATMDSNKQRARQFQEGLDALINPYLTVGRAPQQVEQPAFEVIWVEK